MLFIVFLTLSCSMCGGGENLHSGPSPVLNEDVAAAAAMDGKKQVNKSGKKLSVEELEALAGMLEPLHKKPGSPKPGDWLAVHSEPGQTFKQYVKSKPSVPDSVRTTIYIQPLGDFTPGQEKLVKLTADFMEIWFGLTVKTKENISLDLIPESARRVHPVWGDKQILTGYVLDKLLLPTIPDDAIGYLALTASDLWPGEGWNFVFGQASLSQRVGVWSVYRKGNADGTEEQFIVTLRRTLQTATHEMGHMIGMLHCIEWECDMNGSNSLDESDRRPLPLCPECLKKLLWATKVDPASRFDSLARFCDKQGMEKEKEYYEKAGKLVK